MNDFKFRHFAGWFLGFFLLLGVVFVASTALDLEVARFFGIKRQSIQTDIYRENKSFVEGTRRDLRELRLKYIEADPAHQDALRSLILHRAGELDRDRLPLDLQQFLVELEQR